jgi:bacillopeptidase F
MSAPVSPAATKPMIDPSLMAAAKQKPVDAIVFFNPVNDPSTRDAVGKLQQAEAMPFGPQRKVTAYEGLKEIGTRTLEANMPTLETLKRSGKVEGIDPLWSFNAVRLRGASADALSALQIPSVMGITPDEKVAVPAVAPLVDAVEGASLTSMVPLGKWERHRDKAGVHTDPNAVFMDWGVKKMDAPAAWKQGITGAGITIASLDTGVITDHPGLHRNYRGTKPDGTQDHNYNLWNVVEKGATQPVDDVAHGTHTIGSAVGYHPNHLVGVAPDAKYIGVRALGNAGGSLFGLMNAMEWMLAPTDLSGKNPRPDMAPDIITNSWGGGAVSNPFLWKSLRNWRAAGLVPVFAAGNNRKAQPGEVASPGLYSETITVGATEKDDSRAFFSMYGPSKYSKDYKPEVMAPGTWTYSAYPDGTFRDTFVVDGKEYPASGTSMATPHVAGAMALYMQANPDATFEEIREALKAAGTLADAPEHERGYGRVQVDKLITPDSIDKKAKLTDKERVEELMGQVAKAQVFGEGKTDDKKKKEAA